MRLSITIIGVVLLCGCSQNSEEIVQPNYDLLSQCERPEQPSLTSIYAESLCGTITVFEDRDSGTGRTIDLNVMVIPAIDSVSRPDPIFFLAGGPGQAATDVGPSFFASLRDLRIERDIVLVDQRGTGKSNSLACEIEAETNLESLSADIEELIRLSIEQVRECLAGFDADPRLYTTPVAMDDLNEVREKLGYRSINLYGGSYGTRAALVYMRRHGDSVRSAVLDSVAPMTMSIPLNVAIDAQSAFDTLLADCRRDERCAAAFPELESHFNELLTRLDKEPLRTTLPHPRTGEDTPAVFGRLNVTRLIRVALYDRMLSSLLPLAINEAHRENFKPILTLAYGFTANDSGQMSIGMMASVLCAEDMKLATEPNNTDNFDNAVYNAIKPICEFWPAGSVPDSYFEPVVSELPVLLLSGTLDPITPPKYGEAAAATLSNSNHVIVPGVGHIASSHGCVPDLVAGFLDNPDPGTINEGCVGDLRRPPFFTSFTGTALPAKAEDDS
jgi:pimeloyl-ACP methyl ester carboxylesterase